MRIGHHLAQAVHGQVEVVHALPFPAVNLETELVHFLLGDLFLQFVLVAVVAAAASYRLGISRTQELTGAHLLALALRGGGHGRTDVVVVVVMVRVVVSEKHIVHVRGGGSAARAGV